MQILTDDGRDRLLGVCLGVNGLLAVGGDPLKPAINIVTDVGGGVCMLTTREDGNNMVPATIAEICRANGVTGAKVGDVFVLDPHKVSHGHDDLGKMLGVSHEQVHDLKSNFKFEVKEVKRFTRKEIAPSPQFIQGAQADYFLGVARRDDDLIMLVDLEKVLSSEEKIELHKLTHD